MPRFLFTCALFLPLILNLETTAAVPDERLSLNRAVVDGNDNLFGDEIPIAAPSRLLRRAWKELSALPDEGLREYAAVFYLFPADGKPVTLTGALLPASDGLENLHEAVMHVKVDEKSLRRIDAIDGNTLVYGVDGSGNIAWYPWKFFAPNPLFDGYYTSDGIYAYTYRPSPKLLGRYGRKAYYLNIINPDLLEGAELIDRENITLYMGRVAEITMKVAWYTVPAFFSPLVEAIEKNPGMADLPYEFRVVGSNTASPGQIAVMVPFGLEYENAGEVYTVYPDDALFEGLGLYRAEMAPTLDMLGFADEAAQVRAMDLAVTHFSEAGDLTISRREVINGAPVTHVTFSGDGTDPVALNFQDPYLTVDPDAEDGGWSAGVLRHIETNGRLRKAAVPVSVPTGKWRDMYDTELHGISRVAKPPRVRENADPLLFGPERHFELDVQPSFRDRPFGAFLDWLSDQMDERTTTIGTGDYYETAVMEFTVDETGAVRDVFVWDSTIPELTALLHLIMVDADGWSPGELAGVPVKVRYRVDVGLEL